MTTREELLQYAQSVHLAIHGTDIPRSGLYSDHPYSGFDLDLIKDLVDGDLVKSQVRDFENDIKKEVQVEFDNLAINCPIKVTKGSKDKRKRATRRITTAREEKAIIEDYNAGFLTNKQVCEKHNISIGALHNIRYRNNVPSKNIDNVLGKAVAHEDLKDRSGIYAIANKYTPSINMKICINLSN